MARRPDSAERQRCAELAEKLKAEALFLCSAKASPGSNKGRHGDIRDLCLQAAAAMARPGRGGLRNALRESVIPGAPQLVQVKNRTRALRLPTQRKRRMKAQRYDAAARVLMLLLSLMDRVTGDVCRAENRDFVGILVSTIAEKLDLDQRRVERVLWVFAREGIIESWQRSDVDENTGEIYGMTAVRKINMDALAPRIRDGLLTEWQKIRAEESRRRAAGSRTLSADQMAATAGREAAERNLRRLMGESSDTAKPTAGLRRVEEFTTGAGLSDQLARLKARAGPL